MTTRLHQLRFWLITITALLLAGATFSLGQWQLRRAAQKEALQTAIVGDSLLDKASPSAVLGTFIRALPPTVRLQVCIHPHCLEVYDR